MDPLKHYKNIAMLSHFVNDLGMIKPGRLTGLTVGNQKKIAKLIKRAQNMGLIPYTHRLSGTGK
jgi:small subunit ribosomal protein S18